MADTIQAEQLAIYQQAFRLCDLDGSGTIATQEIATLLRKAGQNPTKAEVDEIMHAADFNGNGTVSFQEFINAMQRNNQSHDGASTLFIGNLDKRVTGNMMLDIFKKGLVTVTDKVMSSKMNPSETECAVIFKDNATASLGMKFINGREFFGKKVQANWQSIDHVEGVGKGSGETHSIYVGDLCDTVDDASLKKFFEPVGPVVSVKVVRDLATFQSKGFGFVSFQNKEDAATAIEQMNGQQLGKKAIKTNWASRNKGQAQMQNKLNYTEVLQASEEDNCTMYVGSLPSSIQPDSVKKQFEEYGGTIVDTRVFVDKGYAFIKYSTHAEAAQAITKANGQEFYGSYLKCWWGKPQGADGFPFNQGKQMGSPQGNASMYPVQYQQPSISYEEMHANMKPMFDANNISPETRCDLLKFMQENVWYYTQCMTTWKNWEQSQQMAAAAAHSGHMMNPMQYATMYTMQQQQQQQSQQQPAAGYQGQQQFVDASQSQPGSGYEQQLL